MHVGVIFVDFVLTLSPINLFSTISILPIPCSPPNLFNSTNISSGSLQITPSGLFTQAGTPCLNPISIRYGLSSACVGSVVIRNSSLGGSVDGFSKIPDSKLICSKLASMLQGALGVTDTGIEFCSANLSRS